jgi:hypothetical protein
MPGMVFTPSLLRVLCKRLSSVVVVLCTAFFFLRDNQPISQGASTHARPENTISTAASGLHQSCAADSCMQRTCALCPCRQS